MSEVDVFREVDEEVRREQLKKLWDRYGIYVVVLAVLVVAAVGAWRGYQWWEAKKAAEAGAAFEAAITLSDGGKHAEAEQAFAKIAADSTSGYRQLARIREAAELVYQDPKAAAAAFEKINQQIMEEYLPGLPISHSPPALVVGPDVEGLIPSPLTAEEFNTVSVGGQ